MRFHHKSQGNLLESLQQALRCRMGRCPFRIARIQSRQGSAFLSQPTTHHKLHQRQNAQGNRQQTNQASGVIIPLDIHGGEGQRVSLQATEAALHQILVAVGFDILSEREPICRLIRRVHAPAQLRDHTGQGFRFHRAADRKLARDSHRAGRFRYARIDCSVTCSFTVTTSSPSTRKWVRVSATACSTAARSDSTGLPCCLTKRLFSAIWAWLSRLRQESSAAWAATSDCTSNRRSIHVYDTPSSCAVMVSMRS